MAALWMATLAGWLVATSALGQQSPGPTITYSQGVAQLLQKHCVSCHNPAGGAPFNLLTYADAKQWGEQILDVTQSRYMPPWLPVPDTHSALRVTFKGERRLSDADRDALRRWVGAGMPEGPAAVPSKYESTRQLQQAGPPDLKLTLGWPIHVPASGPDLFLTFALPMRSGAAHDVRALAIEASDPQAAHSVFIGVDARRLLRAEHPEVLASGLPGMELNTWQTETFAPGGQILLWTPDEPMLVAVQPWLLPANSDLVLTVHIKPTGKVEELGLSALVYYAKSARAEQHSLLHLEHDDGLVIASGEREVKVEAQATLKQATVLSSIFPRAHYAARSMEAYAILPDRSRRTLLAIDQWDADWTSVYRFEKPVTLPKGAVIHMSYAYDNSSSNPHNPSDPPEKIIGGHSAKEEVAEVWMETTIAR